MSFEEFLEAYDTEIYEKYMQITGTVQEDSL